MPSDSELMAIIGFCATRAASVLKERRIDHTLPDNDVPGSLLSGRRFAGLPVLGPVEELTIAAVVRAVIRTYA